MNIISASYGNDSIAMMQWAHENKLKNVTVAYCLTGWASPDWNDRVLEGERLADKLGFKSVRIKSMGMVELARMKSGFPANGLQFCSAWLKGFPFLDWLENFDKNLNAVVLIGKRREESEERKNTPEFINNSEFHGGRMVWHPLYLHTENMRDDLLKRAGIGKLSHRSDECSPCVNANREDLRRLSNDDINKTFLIENEIGKPFFRAEKKGGAVGIFEVIKWAKYSKGQYKKGQDDLFIEGCGSPFGCGL